MAQLRQTFRPPPACLPSGMLGQNLVAARLSLPGSLGQTFPPVPACLPRCHAWQDLCGPPARLPVTRPPRATFRPPAWPHPACLADHWWPPPALPVTRPGSVSTFRPARLPATGPCLGRPCGTPACPYQALLGRHSGPARPPASPGMFWADLVARPGLPYHLLRQTFRPPACLQPACWQDLVARPPPRTQACSAEPSFPPPPACARACRQTLLGPPACPYRPARQTFGPPA
ncbi:uncharacterized protein LOC135211485 [Macrobrachium nipponense]|uniref:uncharacterized protein LOC135211485 n=1 Tax=Macrobrachium nipponense TaxID=159736 RepID=UPI0030C7A4BE